MLLLPTSTKMRVAVATAITQADRCAKLECSEHFQMELVDCAHVCMYVL